MWISSKNSFFEKIEAYTRTNPKTSLLIFSPYIKRDVLVNLLQHISPDIKVEIVTTWKFDDLLRGSSDLDIYLYCKERGYSLYLNQNIHLKVICSDGKQCIFGSANITSRGLAVLDKFNFELFSEPTNLDVKTRIYFQQILNSSILVNDMVYSWYLEKIKTLPKLESVTYDNCPINVDVTKDFLISALPMSISPQKFYTTYSLNYDIEDREELDCGIHDAALYQIEENYTESLFYEHLKASFFKQPFIVALLQFIDDAHADGRYFGEVKEWIQKHCTNVPVPSKRDLTGNIQVLYKWISSLSEGIYVVDVPGSHSERIRKDE